MNRLWQFAICILTLLFSIEGLQAGLYIEISGGRVGGIPILISPFAKNYDFNNSLLLEEFHQIINRNLKNTGLFDCKNMPGNPIHEFQTEVKIANWQALGVAHLVRGQINLMNNNKFKVEFELLNISPKKQDLPIEPVISMSFEHIGHDAMRALAHHISDLVYEKLTGIKGIFSTKIAYVAVEFEKGFNQYYLNLADYDGFNPKVVQNSKFPMMSPRWSPDGEQLAYVDFEGNRSSIKILNLKNGRVRVLCQYPGINGAPAWSPSGQELAIVLSKSGSPKLYSIQLASGEIEQLTSGASIDTEPFYATDNEHIVFTSNRGGKAQIYQLNKLSKIVTRLSYKGTYNARPSLSNDGKSLIMMHRAEAKGPFSIAKQDIGSGQIKVLTHSYYNESPSLAPNGQMVLYGLENGALGAVSINGQVKLRLPAERGEIQDPAWSPFLLAKF